MAETSSGHELNIGSRAGPELLRLFPAFFAGESLFAVLLLLLFLALSAVALFHPSDQRARYRLLGELFAAQGAAVLVYVLEVGGGVAKIAIFRPFGPFSCFFWALAPTGGFSSWPDPGGRGSPDCIF